MNRFKAFLLSSFAGILLAPLAFAASGDLSVSTPSLSDQYITQGETVMLTVSGINNSQADLLGVIRITVNGEVIDGDQPISVLAGDTDEVFVFWQPQSYGAYTIKATVVPWDASLDDPSNNVSSVTVFVEQDTDYDGIPNAQDDDMDGDGVLNDEDEFPLDGSESKDSDGDGTGNNADTDDDNDGVLDEDDAFPEDPLFSSDQDGDSIPDEEDEDVDGDGIPNDEENKAGTNPSNPDTDGDGTPDGSDAFPSDSNETLDTDGDGIGDSNDDDIDGDGIANDVDAHPTNRGPSAEADQSIYLTDIGDEVQFTANKSEDPDGEITSYVWEFEDGTVLYGPEVSHSFEEKGSERVILTTIDDTGQSAQTEVKVRILDYQFLMWAILFALVLILLAFYLIHRYNRRASGQKKKTSKKKSKKKSK